MKPFPFVFLALALFAKTSVAVVAADKPTITWAFSATENISDRARARMMDEENPLYKLFLNNLPEYKAELFHGTVNRIENELKTKNRTCYLASTNLDRRVAFAYLTPISINPDPLVVTRKEVALQIQNPDKTVSLKKLVQQKNLEGIFIDSRSFGTSIDSLLTAKESHLHFQTMTPIGPSSLKMIQTHRADYTLEFDYILQGLREAHDFGPDLAVLPLSDIKGGVIEYAACSRTPDGLAIIQRIDQVARENVSTPVYSQSILALAPELERKEFLKEAAQFIKRRGSTSEIH